MELEELNIYGASLGITALPNKLNNKQKFFYNSSNFYSLPGDQNCLQDKFYQFLIFT